MLKIKNNAIKLRNEESSPLGYWGKTRTRMVVCSSPTECLTTLKDSVLNCKVLDDLRVEYLNDEHRFDKVIPWRVAKSWSGAAK